MKQITKDPMALERIDVFDELNDAVEKVREKIWSQDGGILMVRPLRSPLLATRSDGAARNSQTPIVSQKFPSDARRHTKLLAAGSVQLPPTWGQAPEYRWGRHSLACP